MNFDYIVCGSGLAGSTASRILAEKGKKVLILEKLPHTGGSVYDQNDDAGILIHKYGPHIFHTNDQKVFEFLSRFTEWNDYQHRVIAKLDGFEIPVPFNTEALRRVYGEEKAVHLTALLKDTYGTDTVSIMALRDSENAELKELGEYVYNNVFLYYTMKQWEKKPSEIDPATTARVPVRLSDDDRYFTDKYQGMPTNGYTSLINNMLAHENITVETGCDALTRIALRDGKIYFDGKETSAKVIYTGETDRLFGFVYGKLPYRTIDFVFETHNVDSYQNAATVNYTVSEKFTRITEFKKLTWQKKDGITTIMKEYSRQYEGKEGEIPYYPIKNDDSTALYEKYRELSSQYPALTLLGRLAEYKYYNMDAVVAHVIDTLSAV